MAVSTIQSERHNISLRNDLCGKPYLGPLVRVIQSFRDNYLSMNNFGRKLGHFRIRRPIVPIIQSELHKY
jgi:hypothetical protein